MGTGDIVVMKFGGTSVAEPDDIRRAARRIVAAREEGKRVVAVLSARGKTTDDLVSMAHEVSDAPAAREMDMLLSTGERISCALCAMAIHDLGYSGISLTGSQAGIVTDSSHTKARILDVRADRIRSALDEDRIVLVAGFQGVSGDSRDVTTLGRGGSDTTAVAIAAALGAAVCQIYTDVRGVFSADPRLVDHARLLPFVSFEEMLEMAASGARVLQLRSVEYARNHGVRMECRSSFEDGPGTLVLSEQDTMERPSVTAVTHAEEARVTLTFDRPVNVDGFDPLLLLVSDADEQGVRYEGSGVVTLTGPVVVRIGLAEIGASIGPGVTLTANAGAGIVAADGGAAWAGVTDLDLPFP